LKLEIQVAEEYFFYNTSFIQKPKKGHPSMWFNVNSAPKV